MPVMYTKEQQEKALAEFERLGSARAVIQVLAYDGLNAWHHCTLGGY